jgi:hypothetical protein
VWGRFLARLCGAGDARRWELAAGLGFGLSAPVASSCLTVAETYLLNRAMDGHAAPMHLAFAAAFGGAHGQAPGQANGQAVVYKPGTILWIGDRAVLISPAKATDDCHACAGTLAVHYLKAAGDKFEVTGAWPDVVSGPGWGLAPKWRLTNTFTNYPAIYEEGTGTGQGYACTMATLVELTPAGPVKSGPIPLHYDNEGAVTDEQAKRRIDGRFVNVRKGASFDIAYTGSETLTETWAKRGDAFVLEGGQSKVTQC